MTLSEKFSLFRKKLPEDMPRPQLLFAQASYLAGAQAAFQILANASAVSQEEAILIWGGLQKEILDAVARPAENLVVAPPEKHLII